jgi:Zn-dependent peptidase ImmA (M78 family)
MDLADAGSPEKLVLEILKCEPSLEIPVPIKDLALQLDIIDIVPLDVEGFEGGLITQAEKFNGAILFNEECPETRQRFTIAHELGHFLMPSHIPSPNGRFLCKAADLLILSAKEGDRRMRMEVEANRFASLILMPPKILKTDLAKSAEPNLSQIIRMASRYEVSKEAMGRAYVTFRPERLAIIHTKDGRLVRHYPGRHFPRLTVSRNAELPRQALLKRRTHRNNAPSDIDETDAGVWIDVRHGQSSPPLYEQVLLQQNGYATTMLWLGDEQDDEDDRDDEAEMTAKERMRHRQARWET